jgi:hypothetical protein
MHDSIDTVDILRPSNANRFRLETVESISHPESKSSTSRKASEILKRFE